MDAEKNKQKLYVYVDEAGQDDASGSFVVVTAIFVHDIDAVRKHLLELEERANTHGLKWHKCRHDRRIQYLSLVLEHKIAAGCVFVGRYRKPIHYFFPTAAVIERAIKQFAKQDYIAKVHVDGANKKVARELTNALRANGISLHLVKGKTDEGEVLIRFADMWAGCVRSALLNEKDSLILFNRALRTGYIQETTT